MEAEESVGGALDVGWGYTVLEVCEGEDLGAAGCRREAAPPGEVAVAERAHGEVRVVLILCLRKLSDKMFAEICCSPGRHE